MESMPKVTIPISGNFLSEKFNDCSNYQIIEIDEQGKISRKDGMPPQLFLTMLPDLANQYGITDIIAHSIDNASLKYINDTKINLFVGLNISTPEQLIDAYLEGSLQSNTHQVTTKKDTLS
jgi:predicted Fe-Mo cluster-binding NifX family protein